LDVFVKEPLIEWTRRKQRRKHTDDDDAEELREGLENLGVASQEKHLGADYAREQVATVKRKLRGDNSAAILADVLKKHGQYNKWMSTASMEAGLDAIVKGDPTQNARARLAATDLSVSDQVDCLIDHATDENIWARTWQGWKPHF